MSSAPTWELLLVSVKDKKTMEQAENNNAFSCRIENVKTITDILHCMCFDLSKAQDCNVEVSTEGLLIIFNKKL